MTYEAAFHELFGSTVALFHRLRVVVEEVHGRGKLSAARRGVLRTLALEVPRTVPQIARSRPVSRQYMQGIVDRLLKEGAVELLDNPAHRRSRLVALTGAGRRLVRAMERRETALLRDLPTGISARDVHRAAEVLDRVRLHFEGGAWAESVERQTRRKKRAWGNA